MLDPVEIEIIVEEGEYFLDVVLPQMRELLVAQGVESGTDMALIHGFIEEMNNTAEAMERLLAGATIGDAKDAEAFRHLTQVMVTSWLEMFDVAAESDIPFREHVEFWFDPDEGVIPNLGPPVLLGGFGVAAFAFGAFVVYKLSTLQR